MENQTPNWREIAKTWETIAGDWQKTAERAITVLEQTLDKMGARGRK